MDQGRGRRLRGLRGQLSIEGSRRVSDSARIQAMGALASDLEREYWDLLRSALQKIMKTIGDEIRRMTLPFEVRSVKADTDGQYAEIGRASCREGGTVR